MRKFGALWGRLASLHIFLGLAFGQGIVLVSTPLLTRLYSPYEIGVSGTFLAAASILGTVATFRFEALIPAAEGRTITWLIKCASISTGVTTSFAVLAFWFFSGFDILNALLFGVTVLGLAGVGLLMQIAARRKNLKGIPTAKALQGAGQTGIQLASGISAIASFGMQLGIAAGYILSAATQMLFLRRADPLAPGELGWNRRPRKRQLFRQASVLVVAALINICTVWMYPLLTQAFFGVEVTGQLTVAQRIGLAPAALIVASLSPVVISRMSELIREGHSVGLEFKRWLIRLSPLGCLALIAMLMVPENWLEIVLGGDWSLSRDYLSAMGLMVAAQVVIGPFGMLLVLQGRSRHQLLWDASRLVALLGVTSATAALSQSPVAMIWAASIVLTLFYCAYAIIVLRGGGAR
ncbi:hypothetical protein ACTAQI_11735 [Pseudarthrobacter sp. alpha12b]